MSFLEQVAENWIPLLVAAGFFLITAWAFRQLKLSGDKRMLDRLDWDMFMDHVLEELMYLAAVQVKRGKEHPSTGWSKALAHMMNQGVGDRVGVRKRVHGIAAAVQSRVGEVVITVNWQNPYNSTIERAV